MMPQDIIILLGKTFSLKMALTCFFFSFFNSSCEPNCKTVPDSEEIFKDAGDARYEKLVIVTTTDIHKDEELTINYQWKNLQCLCGTKSCHNPAEEKLWNV